VTDTEANTIVRPLYLFITIVIIKEGRTKKHEIFNNILQKRGDHSFTVIPMSILNIVKTEDTSALC
jgi:hypothetical protein